MRFEALWYETSPYVYFVFGLSATLFSHSAVGLAFSATLVSAAATIVCLRQIYRSPARQRLRKYARPAP